MRLSVAVAAVCLSLVGLSVADDARASIRRTTNIPAQGLVPALKQLAHERNLQVVFQSEVVGAAQTHGAVGELTTQEALSQLLQGTNLSYRFLDDMTITILSASPPGASGTGPVEPSMAAPSASNPQKESANSGAFLLAQAATGQATSTATVASADEKNREKIPEVLQEVIVTATKREERLQDVPMSITVIGNQEIERRGLTGMEDYLRSIPGVNQIDQGPFSNAIVIRGITTSPTAENFYSGTTVASYFGETPITGAAGPGGGGIDVRPVDIERIEVLRGPQGTEFGDASLGGTLRMIPVKPKLDGLTARLATDYSNTSGYGGGNSMLQGIVNVPIVSNEFAVRAVGYRYQDSGYYRNIAGIDPATLAIFENANLGNLLQGYVQNDVGRIVTTGGRLAALWRPSDKLDVSMNYLTQTIEQDGDPAVQIDPSELATAGTYEQARAPIASQARVRGEAGEVADTKIHLSNIVLNYDLAWSELTSVASWIDSGSVYAHDLSAGFLLPASTTDRSDFRSFTAEVRLASKLEGRFQFLGGLFYGRVNDGSTQSLDWPGTPDTSPFGTNPMAIIGVTRHLDQRATFGELSYKLTERLTAMVGGRYFKYDKSERDLNEGGLFGTAIGGGVPQDLENSEGHSRFKADLEYRPRKNVLVYSLWSQGFRLGHPSAGVPPGVCDTNGDGLIDGSNVSVESTRHVNSDFLDNYELGGKFTFFDQRMSIDTSAYHIKWKGLPIAFGAGTCPIGFTANVGAAKSDGAELQASMLVASGLRVDVGGGYTRAILTTDAPALGVQEGAPLPGAPKLSANLAVQYDFKVSVHNAFVRADSFYTGQFYGDVQKTPDLVAGDYTKIDVRSGVTFGKLGVELFGRNLTNAHAFTWRGGTATQFAGYRLRPRTIGIQLGYNFE